MGPQKHNNLPCRIIYELFTELLIRAIGEEVQRPEFLGKRILVFEKYLHGVSFLAHMTNQACEHMPSHISTHKWQYITIAHRISLINVHIHTHTHALTQTGHILFIQLFVELYIIRGLTLVTVSHPAVRRWVPGNFLSYIVLTKIVPTDRFFTYTKAQIYNCIRAHGEVRILYADRQQITLLGITAEFERIQ